MFGASIAIAEDAENDHVPVGAQSIMISDDVHHRNSTASSSSGSAPNTQPTIQSLYVELPALDGKQSVFKEGFLHKIGGNVKNWKTRYFRLCVGRLIYYKDGENSGSDSRLGAILLPGATIAIFAADVHPGHAFCFGLTPADNERQYIFDCDSVAHRMEWITALQPAIKQRLRVTNDSIREGYLTKLGGNVKNWKKRYCILTKSTLKYYPSHADLHELLGTVDLANGFMVGSDDNLSDPAATAAASDDRERGSISSPGGASSSSSSQFLTNNPYNFSLKPLNMERTYIFCTTTKSDRDGWIQVLQELQKGSK